MYENIKEWIKWFKFIFLCTLFEIIMFPATILDVLFPNCWVFFRLRIWQFCYGIVLFLAKTFSFFRVHWVIALQREGERRDEDEIRKLKEKRRSN